MKAGPLGPHSSVPCLWTGPSPGSHGAEGPDILLFLSNAQVGNFSNLRGRCIVMEMWVQIQRFPIGS